MAFGVNSSRVVGKSICRSSSLGRGLHVQRPDDGSGFGRICFLGNVSEFFNGYVPPDLKTTDRNILDCMLHDTWKVNQKLTLTYGLRWEPYFPQINRDGTSVHFDGCLPEKVSKSNRFLNTPPGLFYDGDPGFPNGQKGFYRSMVECFAALGLAWDVSGDGRTALRIAWLAHFMISPSSNYLVGHFCHRAPFKSTSTADECESSTIRGPTNRAEIRFPLPYGQRR